jgi:sigma-B regulation protein RsbU (phosphoserine phosphatase)
VNVAGGIDLGDLLDRVDNLVRDLPRRPDKAALILEVARAVSERLPEELGIVGGRLFRFDAAQEGFVLEKTFGLAERLVDPPLLPRGYTPVEICLEEGVVYMEPGDPALDPELERAFGAQTFAAVRISEESMLLSFDLRPSHGREAALVSLAVLRHAINLKLREGHFDDVLEEARKIQLSLLPKRIPSYGNFDLAGRSEPMEAVGGDFYDFIPLSEKIFGIAVADVSGHGLPAALQVRDIYTGLRMGLARDYKIVRTIERLNDIIHRSSLTSRFVSLFYGELELSGNFLYVNAGHPPPFHLSAAGEATRLERGGLVLGPIPGAAYERGFVQLVPGDLLVLYTDGIVEAHCHEDEEEFGFERLVDVVRACRELSASEIVAEIFGAVSALCSAGQASDDRTVVVVKYPGEGG